MSIRTATLEDIPSIIQLLSTLWSESDLYKIHTPNVEWATTNLHAMLGQPQYIMLVDNVGDELRGVAFAHVGPTWYADTIETHEMLVAVLPKWRGGLLAVKLIKAMEQAGYARNASYIFAGASLGINDDAIKGLYRVLGYSEYGAGFYKRL